MINVHIGQKVHANIGGTLVVGRFGNRVEGGTSLCGRRNRRQEHMPTEHPVTCDRCNAKLSADDYNDAPETYRSAFDR